MLSSESAPTTQAYTYMEMLLGEPSRESMDFARLAYDHGVDGPTMARTLGTQDPSGRSEDAVLRARFWRYARDIGMAGGQATAVLKEHRGPLTMDEYKTLLGSVAIVSAARLSYEASQKAVMVEVTNSIAFAAHARFAYIECRAPPGRS